MGLSITEISSKVDRIVDGLFVSMSNTQIEDVFQKNSIDDRMERIQLLRKCMHVVDTSNSNDPISIDDEYNDEVTIFLDGRWRQLI